jgi:pyruvate,water dikinase
MSTPLFIWLGSGRARRRAVGPPARQLDQAAQAGLPVPAGAVLLDEFFRFALASGLAQVNGRRIVSPDAELWHNTLFHSVRLPRFRRPVVVQAAADATTNAPPFTDRDVDFNDALAAARAVEAVWSAAPPGDTSRRDTLIIESVAASTTGAATTRSDTDDDWVALAGAAPFALPQLRGRRGPDADQPPYVRRLQQLLRGVRRTFGPGAWRIEWADDGRICWLRQVLAVSSSETQPVPTPPGVNA